MIAPFFLGGNGRDTPRLNRDAFDFPFNTRVHPSQPQRLGNAGINILEIRASFSTDEGETWDLDSDVPIRQDLLNWDIGYPEWRQLADGRVLTVYYYNLLGRY